MTDIRSSRRRILGGVGTAALLGVSGCSAISGWQDEPPTIPASELRAIVDESPPILPETFPADIESSYLDSIAEGISGRLYSVPTPFTASDIPNGAIRKDLNHQRDRVDTLLQTANESDSPYEALWLYRRARGQAASVAAAWATIDHGLTRDDVIGRTSELETARSEFVRRWEYLGTEPIRSTVVHSALEQRVRTTERIIDIDESDLDREPANAITIGELAGEVERGFASIEDAEYLYDRHLQSLPDPMDQRAILGEAAATLARTIESRHASLPSVDPSNPSALVDRDISDTPAAEVLEGLYWRLDSPSYPSEELLTGRPAHAIVVAKTILARLRAFTSVLDQVEAGETYEVLSSEEVRASRAEAISAITSAQSEITKPVLANSDLARLADQLQDVDSRLKRHEEDVATDLIDYEIAVYVQTTAVAHALPATIEQVTTMLRNEQ